MHISDEDTNGACIGFYGKDKICMEIVPITVCMGYGLHCWPD